MSPQSVMHALAVTMRYGSCTLCAAAFLVTTACAGDKRFGSTAHAVSPPPIELSADGVGEITAETLFTIEAIRDAFPYREVTRETRTTEGEAYPVIEVREGDSLLLTVNSDQRKVDSVVVSSNKINNTIGDAIGSRFTAVYDSEATCLPGREELSGYVLCPAPVANNVTYIFEGEWRGPDDVLPPGEVLGQWHLSQILWTPSGGRNRTQQDVRSVPGFNCAKASGKVEELICANPELAALDRQLAQLYKGAVETANETHLRTSQRGWIKGRDDCWKAMHININECVTESYRARIDELQRPQEGDNR